MNWIAVKISTGVVVNKVLTDDEKNIWENHHTTKYRFRYEPAKEESPKKNAPPPLEAEKAEEGKGVRRKRKSKAK